jgi:hypothetical protein
VVTHSHFANETDTASRYVAAHARDWADIVGLALALALVIVGGLGARIALRTLRDVKRQTDAIERLTIHIANNERPWPHSELAI